MKNTYLARHFKENGKAYLVEVTGDEWKKIITANKTLPVEERRYFIAHCIEEPDGIDRMYIEVSKNEYQKWNSENTSAGKKRKYKNQYTLVSLDDYLLDQDNLFHGEVVTDDKKFEDEVMDSLSMYELKEKLAAWQPWALDLLEAYLSGRKKECTAEIADKYGVSKQTARSYKQTILIIKYRK